MSNSPLIPHPSSLNPPASFSGCGSNPILLSTWKFGQKAVEAGWPYLASGAQSTLDAVEQACRAVEADPEIVTVGRGGYPDQSGEVTLDASIMLSPDRCGAVCYVRRFLHPVSIARLVMERSPHVMLAGEGAERFARRHGIEPSDLGTEQSRTSWEKWITEHPEAEQAHDTIGVLARDAAGQTQRTAASRPNVLRRCRRARTRAGLPGALVPAPASCAPTASFMTCDPRTSRRGTTLVLATSLLVRAGRCYGV